MLCAEVSLSSTYLPADCGPSVCACAKNTMTAKYKASILHNVFLSRRVYVESNVSPEPCRGLSIFREEGRNV